MTKLVYNDNNTEGHHPTSFDFIDTEIRKDDKIVATDLTDLYDVELTNLQNGEILVYDSAKEKWVNGEASAGCDVITADTIMTVGESGTFNNLKECFDWLRNNCKKISEDVILTIKLVDYISQTIDYKLSLNHPYGHRINIIGGNGMSINVESDILDYIIANIPVNIDFIQVACGSEYTIAIKQNGTLWATGYNEYGQLGLGDNTDKNVFNQEVGTDTDWDHVACGILHTMAIKQDGTLWATGHNVEGQLGLGDNIDRNVFTQVGTDTDWKYVSCGMYHSIAIKQNGTLWATGYNGEGGLGLGDGTDRNVFTQEVGNDTDWKQVDGGMYHSIAIKQNGTLWATGYNSEGQLGLGDNFGRTVFTQEVGNDTDWKQVDGGFQHSIAIKQNGTLWATGYNYWGELGLGDNTSRNVFTQVDGDTDWSYISCGLYHSIALKQNGTLWGTGNNYIGQLGLGDNVDRNVFTQEVGTDTDWDHVDGGYGLTISIKQDGTLWGTGLNDNGGLGLGDNIDRNVFTQRYTIEIYIHKDQITNHNNGIFISDNHTINNITNLSISVNIVYGNIDTSCGYKKSDYPYNAFVVENNSSTSIYNSYSPETEDRYISVKNNSYVFSDNNQIDFYIENNSSVESINTDSDIFTVKNRSTILTDNITKFDNSTFINSKLIEKK